MADSKEEKNYWRIVSLLYKVAPSAVRVKFDEEFHPTNGLESALNQAKWRVVVPLKEKKIINQVQWDLMYPTSGLVSSKTFDLTLMICLLRNLASIQVGETLPHPSVISKAADLSRLKYYRNKFAHHDGCTLTDENFEIYWNDICQGINGLGGPEFTQICQDVKDMTLNNNDKEILIEIRNLEKSSTFVPTALQKQHEDLINEWGQDDKKVVKTRAISRINELLKSADVIVAVGPSGCGKSIAIHHVALWLHNEEGFTIVPVKSPEEIISYCNPKYKQVFVIDDVCGKSTIDNGLVNRWQTWATNIQQVIWDHKIKILLSCRKHIYLDRSFEGVELLSKTACDLVSSSYSLTEIERNQIASIYLTDSEINAIKQSRLVEKFSFFPLLCSIYSKQKSTGVQDFFANPISVIRSDLDLLRKATDQTTLATMSLFIAFNNSLDENVLSRSPDMTELLEAISDHFYLKAPFSIKVVKSELHKLETSYVKKSVSTYKILHDKIYDIFLAFCGEHFFDLVLEVAHRDVIFDRFVLESIQNENQNLAKENIVITVYDKEEDNYFSRILKDIQNQNGFIKDIFLNRQFKCLTFRNKLFQYLRHKVEIKNKLLDVSSEDLSNMLLSMTRQCYWDMVPILLTYQVDVNIRDWKGTPLYFASEKRNIDIAKLLLDHHADPNMKGWLETASQTPLHLAVETENIDLIHLLFAHHANANVTRIVSGFDDATETPLHVALQQKHENIVKLLLDHKADYNVLDQWKRTPLYKTVRQGSPNLTMLLLQYGANPNIGEKYHYNTPLHEAFSKGNIDMIKMLLDYKADLNIKNEDGETPLFKAVEKNHSDIVKIHLKQKDLKVCNNNYESLLFKASSMGHTKLVTLLLENNCDYNVCNTKNESPIFISSLFAHAGTLKVLLEHKCDPNICNEMNMSPLFVASENGHTDIVRLLLEHKCDPNMCNDSNESPLFIASKEGHHNIVKLLLERSCVNMENENKISSFFAASENGHTDIVRLFLEHNCDPNSFNKSDESVLYVAIKKNHSDIVKLLFEHNCNPNICNSKHESVLFCASKTNRAEFVNFLLENNCDPNICNDKNESPLFAASKEGHADIVTLLLEHNCDANICNDTKESPLFIACMCNKLRLVQAVQHLSFAFSRSTQNYTEIVKLLLEHNCDPNTCNDKNESALFGACKTGLTEIVPLLLKENCDPRFCNDQNESPLFAASKYGHLDIVRLLLEQKYDLNIYNNKNESPLFIASSAGEAEVLLPDHGFLFNEFSSQHRYTLIVKLLLKHGFDPHTCNDKNESALFGASKNGQIGIAKLLLEHNCDPNMCNDKNESPLFIASMYGKIDIVKLLLEHHCDPNICNDKNESPLFIASKRGRTSIVKLLLEHNCDSNMCNNQKESPLFIALKMCHSSVVKLLKDKNRNLRTPNESDAS
ncbi:ankyrin-1-like [Mytilus edulis]|uniref:ankyrin-1-like n=1 Tax=Mytilus edulis TaxID=6550 RepID=UPI0039F11D30